MATKKRSLTSQITIRIKALNEWQRMICNSIKSGTLLQFKTRKEWDNYRVIRTYTQAGKITTQESDWRDSS